MCDCGCRPCPISIPVVMQVNYVVPMYTCTFRRTFVLFVWFVRFKCGWRRCGRFNRHTSRMTGATAGNHVTPCADSLNAKTTARLVLISTFISIANVQPYSSCLPWWHNKKKVQDQIHHRHSFDQWISLRKNAWEKHFGMPGRGSLGSLGQRLQFLVRRALRFGSSLWNTVSLSMTNTTEIH